MDLEKKTIESMIDIYCKNKHFKKDRTTKYSRCPICAEMGTYAIHKIDTCKFKSSKPVCSKCSVKCYNSEHRDNIRQVMRYAGPRIILYHPLLLVRYAYRKVLKKSRVTKLNK